MLDCLKAEEIGGDAVLARNRLLADASRSWEIISPAIIRKVQIAGLQSPAVSRFVVLGDAAHD